MRFSLRDLLWAVLVVAVACAWYADREKLKLHYKPVDAFLDTMSLRELFIYINERGGMNNLHMLKLSFSAYYGSTAEMRFTEGETRPVMKIFWMANERIQNSRPHSHEWKPSFEETNEPTELKGK